MSNTQRIRTKVPNVTSDNQPSQNITEHLNKKHVLFRVERSQQVLKTVFLVTTKKKQSRAQRDIFGTCSTSFWKVCVFVSMKSPNIFRKVCTKIIKTIAHNTKRRKPRFQKKSKAVFTNIRDHKTSQTQDVKSQSTKRNLRNLAQAKPNTAVEQK